jgi:mRNA interferase MazF
MPDKQDIYSIKIFYKGTGGTSKVSPVLIINDTPIGKYTIVELTSIAPKDPPSFYDKFKEKIEKWNKYGLDEPSYAKCKNVHVINNTRFIKYIGTMDLDEFEHIVDKIVEANQS